MSWRDAAAQEKRLRDWQDGRLRHYESHVAEFARCGCADVTALLYYYRRPEEVASTFRYSQCAIYETWRCCGIMRTVIVTNAMSEQVAALQGRFPDHVEVQLEPSLLPGSVDSLSEDCLSKLHSRFCTKYVLTIQDDGFPLRSGLERFVGKYDFVGAPFRRRRLVSLAAGLLTGIWPSNGGFSLRSKRICEGAAEAWIRYRQTHTPRPGCYCDAYYTEIFPRLFPEYRRRHVFANSFAAARFSHDGCFSENAAVSPFGFHNSKGFCEVLDLQEDRSHG